MEEEKSTAGSKFLKKHLQLKHIIGLLVGVAGGFLYYWFVGCSSGSCAITSNPWMSMLWGTIMGYLIADMIPIKAKKTTTDKEQDQPK
jgi:hypothetical protein